MERTPVLSNELKENADVLGIALRPEVMEINVKYPYWDKVKYVKTKDNIPANKLWFAIKLLRRLNRVSLKMGRYKFSFTINDEILELLHYFDMNIGGGLSSDNIIPANEKKYYLTSSIMEEAIASSQMEGATTTRNVAKDMLRKSEKPRDVGQQMIFNNYNTINYIKGISQENFSVEILKEIQRSMTVSTLDNESNSGEFRRNNDIVVMDGVTGNIAHIPPSYDEINGLVSDLKDFFNNNNKIFVHPIIKAIIVHFMLAYIHPFVDGNGRTARSLFYWYMMKHGYWLIEYMSISRIIYKTKKQYENAFLYTEYDDNDLTYFILYNLRKMKVAFDELKNYLKRKSEERNNIPLLTKIKGINLRQAQIIKALQDNPNYSFTAKEIENRFSVGNQTARNDLSSLVSLGYLSEIQVNKVKRAYVKSKNFEALVSGYLS